MRRWIPHIISVVLLAVAGIYFWGTAVSTAWARLAALQTIEPYAFAVHEQLLFNFSSENGFFQTIHKGYDDAWTWSGHRALSLPVTGLLYGLAPQPLWLAQIMLTGVLLGAIPAALLGMRSTDSGLGLAWGGLLYLGAPVTMVMATQDYQDLVYALPFLVFAIWAISSGKWWLTIMGALVAIMPREECVPMAIAIAALCPPWDEAVRRPRWKLWGFNIAVTLLVAAAFTGWVEHAYPLAESGHDMPLASAVKGVTGETGSGAIFLEGWLYLERFYALMLVPLGVLILAAPNTALPGVGLILLHMTIPEGHGVDRSWSGHCHHMAPAAAFLIAAMIQGGGRLLRLIAGQTRPRQVAAVLVALGLLGAGGKTWQGWSATYNLVTGFSAKPPVWEHPVWSLVRQLPDDAVPIGSKDTSIAISNRARSYTYDESLAQKASRYGLAAGTHLIADSRKSDLIAWGMAMEGAEVIAESAPFVLISWTPGARDVYAGQRIRIPRGQPWTGGYRKAHDIPGVAPHEQRIPVQQGGFPVIRLR
ncbi:MAG: DUF2079 domain-containing protein [Myxococcota bacterium]|nr:DUF2079 domain-containing protein [Myxococcota bacterium]